MNNAVVDFCRLLALTESLFRKAAVNIRKYGYFKTVEWSTAHAERPLTDGSNRIDTVEVSYSLDCDLPEVTEDGSYSIGASVAIRFVCDHWRCEGDVGWSQKLGWSEYKSREIRLDSLAELHAQLPDFVKFVLADYGTLIEYVSGEFDDVPRQFHPDRS